MKRFALLLAAALALACNSGGPGGLDAGPLGGGSASGGGAGGGGFDAGAVDAGVVTVLRVHYGTTGPKLEVRGSLPPLSWDVSTPLVQGADVWTLSLSDLPSELEFKPLGGGLNWSKGPNYRVKPGATVDVWPHFFNDTGRFEKRWPSFSSTLLGNTRGVWVYLPPTALENSTARFPVVYMHDGQNLFDPSTAFGGKPWYAARAMDTGAADGTIAEAVIVGPENTSARIPEYTPTADPQYPGSGRGDLYLRMLREELMPKVQAELPVLQGPSNTALVGSSLGGLISAYAGTTQADAFGLIGAFSPSTWWDNTVLLTKVAQSPATPRPLRVYVDSGDSGPSSDDKDNTARLAQAYRALGYVEPTTLKYVVQPGATHSEVYWAQRLPAALTFLLGPRAAQ